MDNCIGYVRTYHNVAKPACNYSMYIGSLMTPSLFSELLMKLESWLKLGEVNLLVWVKCVLFSRSRGSLGQMNETG